jgi:hypothetical protein
LPDKVKKISVIFSRFFNLKVILIFTVIFILQSCSVSKLYRKDFVKYLTNERTTSRDGNYSVNIPYGWFASKENSKNVIDLWLIKSDYSATISFVNIQSPELNLSQIANNSLIYRKTNGIVSKRTEKFLDYFFDKMNAKGFSYIDTNKHPVTVIDIVKGNNIYEATLINFSDKKSNKENINTLLAVLFSLD